MGLKSRLSISEFNKLRCFSARVSARYDGSKYGFDGVKMSTLRKPLRVSARLCVIEQGPTNIRHVDPRVGGTGKPKSK